MSDRPAHHWLVAWRESDEGRHRLLSNAMANLKVINALPRCGAKAKSTGNPCRKPGVGKGGRCHWHGGKSTAGRTWGLRQWSDSSSPVVARRQMTKAEWVERTEADRAKRLAAMPPAERARYDAWLSAHAPGSQDGRVGAKLLSAFDQHGRPSPIDMTIEEIKARIDEIKAEKRAWEAYCAVEGRQGVFE